MCVCFVWFSSSVGGSAVVSVKIRGAICEELYIFVRGGWGGEGLRDRWFCKVLLLA